MKLSSVTPLFLCMVALCSCGGNSHKKQSADQLASDAAKKEQLDSLSAAEKKEKVENMLASLPAEPEFDIITTLGTIRVKLFSDTPKHRENFARLSLEGFYDGILFHRVINGFMIQTGDPLSKDPDSKAQWGTGGPGYNVPAEIVPTHHHDKGALAAARRGDRANPLKESSGSQFYIVQDAANCVHLDGEYTIFGQTVDGFDVIDKIASVPTDNRDCPLTPVKIIKISPVHENQQ